MRHVRELIAHGRFAPGEPLPSERILSEETGVARQTVRAALDELASQGLVSDAKLKSRRKVLGGNSPAPAALLSDSVAILADAIVPATAKYATSPGYDTFIPFSAAGRIQAAGLNSLMIQGARVAEKGPEYVVRHRPFGVIITYNLADSPQGLATLDACRRARIPVVAYGDAPALEAYDGVASDHAAGSYDLTRWLAGQGCRRVVRVWAGVEDHTWVQRRDAGHHRAMAEAGLPVVPPVRWDEQRGATFEQRARLAAGYLADHLTGPNPADGLVALNDAVALLAAAACRLLRKAPGRDVRIVGYDHSYLTDSDSDSDSDFGREATGPAATVDKDNAAIAAALVQLLLDRAAGRLPAAPQRRLIAPRLVVPGDAAGATR